MFRFPSGYHSITAIVSDLEDGDNAGKKKAALGGFFY